MLICRVFDWYFIGFSLKVFVKKKKENISAVSKIIMLYLFLFYLFPYLNNGYNPINFSRFFFFKISPCIFFYRFTKKKFLCIVTLLFLKFLISYYPIIVILYSITELGLCGICGIKIIEL